MVLRLENLRKSSDQLDSLNIMFGSIARKVSKKFLKLKNMELHIGCDLAENDHAEEWRHLAHVGHLKNKICTVWDFLKIPSKYQEAIIWHEYGHVIDGKAVLNNPPKHISKYVEKKANNLIQKHFGLNIMYDKNYHYLQYISRGKKP